MMSSDSSPADVMYGESIGLRSCDRRHKYLQYHENGKALDVAGGHPFSKALSSGWRIHTFTSDSRFKYEGPVCCGDAVCIIKDLSTVEVQVSDT